MLAPEVAKTRLADWKIPTENRFLESVPKLPAKLRTIGYALLNRDAKGAELPWRDSTARAQNVVKAAAPLDALGPGDWQKLFGPAFGALAPWLESAWRFLQAGPYQHGWARKAYRAPRLPEASLTGRVGWLQRMVAIADRYRVETLAPAWLATWAPHLEQSYGGSDADTIGRLLAAVIDAGGPTGDEVFTILAQSARGEHELGVMGRHVSRGLLMASRPEGWELMEKMLLAAQRQEGLRQAILETVDEAHPQAFRRMLRIVKENNLARFSAVVRALNVWLGYNWDSVSTGVVNKALALILEYLEDPKARQAALCGREPEALYLALWSVAFEDALASIPRAVERLKDRRAEIRMVAALHLANLGLPQSGKARAEALDDDDLHVAMAALPSWGENHDPDDKTPGEGLFERLERLVARLPDKPITLKPMVWPWTAYRVDRKQVAVHLCGALGNRPATALIPHLPIFATYQRCLVVQRLAEQKKWDALSRDTLVQLAGDASADVRGAALTALGAKGKLEPDEILRLEGYLSRKASDLRQGVVGVLLKQSDALALASAERLLGSKDGQQRLAGLELLRQLTLGKRGREKCQARAAQFQAARAKLSREEQEQITAILDAAIERPTLDNALGLMDPSQRSPIVAPKARKVQFVTSAAVACLDALDELVHRHRETTVKRRVWNGEREDLLGNLEYGFDGPPWGKPVETARQKLPLAEVWEAWWAERPQSLRDKDGLELLRAETWFSVIRFDWMLSTIEQWCNASPDRKQWWEKITDSRKATKLRYDAVVEKVLHWLLYLHPPAGATAFLLSAAETSMAMVPPSELKGLSEKPADAVDWRKADGPQLWMKNVAFASYFAPAEAARPEHVARRWRLARWMDEPIPGACRHRPSWYLVAMAYEAGAATLDDVTDDLLGPEQTENFWGRFMDLGMVTARKPQRDIVAFLDRRPEVRELVEKCRSRIIEIELARGESVTAATVPAFRLGSVWGTELLFRLLAALGQEGFKAAPGWRTGEQQSKRHSLTHLIEVCYPLPADMPEQFVAAANAEIAAGRLGEQRVLELAFLAPQWGRHVERTLGWDGFSEALYWFIAHMRHAWEAGDQAAAGEGIDELPEQDADDDEQKKPKPLSPWQRLIAERTPLSEAQRGEGAVDVDWFRRIYQQVTPKRWQAMAEAARFAATGAQAKRAQFIADVLTGKANRKKLIAAVRKDKLKENVRLLGLLPLAEGNKRQDDLIERYQVLQEYRRYAQGLSSLSKPGAVRACEIGMENLARTAGYADPLRLEWSLEAEQLKRLAARPLTATKSGVSVTLALDDAGQPRMSIEKDGKPQKSVPAPIKKDKRVGEVVEQAAHLKRQASRMKGSLEMAMCRGDAFTAAELLQLAEHPLLAPLLARLVLVGDGVLGYPDKGGRALRDASGKLEPVKKNETLRIAHPFDLLESGRWDQYQRECFQAERVQPIKQVFRELYVVTRQEKRDGAASHRYAGQQVQPRQAFALWGNRGWSTQDGVWKTFFETGITAAVEFQYGAFSPLEVEGLTLEAIHFRRRDEPEPMKLADVPPRIFSEVMRDCDLVVSVAHRGGVDPEASASTVEMRAALLRETCQLLGLNNVRLKDAHALIDGQLGQYSVHLGGATVHRLPGGAVCIVAVPAQHRGRLFLPFADDDPRTAEVIAKVILLARDDEIQDPSILEQLRR